MPVQALTHAAAAANAARSQVTQKADAHTFAGALAQASSKSSANTPDSVLDSTKVPKGEKTEAVKGHAYADITAGPRNGMYLNTSGNKRDGQAFVLLQRGGREYHIYGSGKDRLVVCLRRKEDVDETASAKTKTDKTDKAEKPETKSTAPSGTSGSS
jgi:hypothetical protein